MKVAIVGAGSAGMFAAYKLIDAEGITVDIFEMGKDINHRDRKHIMSGFGGAGAYSDGKLALTTNFGGWLMDFVSEKELKALIDEADTVWKNLSGITSMETKNDYEKIKELTYKCSMHRLRLLAAKFRHLGTDNAFSAIKNMYNKLKQSNNVNIFCEKYIEDLIVENGKLQGIATGGGEKLHYDKVILAVGRIGNDWMQNIALKYNIKFDVNPVDIGVRVETNRAVTDYFTNYLYEFKILYLTSTFEDKVRTFCVNPGGFVATEQNENNLFTVNGHSFRNKKSENTNFALLVSTKFTEPFKEPVHYGQYIAYLANMLSGGSVMIQRFGDLVRGRRSTPKRIEKNFVHPTLESAMPGDLSFVLPYRYLVDIKDTIYQLDKVMPGIADSDTLLYGIEVKFYSLRIKVNSKMRSISMDNLYCIGDGAGITRSIIQASASGIIAAKDILSSQY